MRSFGLGIALVAAFAALLSAGLAGATAARHPQIRVGVFPTGIAIDQSTGTVYVGNGTTGTLSLIDGKTCNATDVHGCHKRVPAVVAGADPIGVAVDGPSNTVYVVSYAGTVAVLDGRRCNASVRSGCSKAEASMRVGIFPQFLAVDRLTDTIYVANSGSNSISVIDRRTCNSLVTSGCARIRATIPVGPAPFALAVDDATGSIYVTDLGAPIVSVIDARTCNARVTSGCAKAPVQVDVGGTPGGIALDPKTDTIYVSGESSNDVSVIDGKTCNARVTSGCRRQPVHVLAGEGARGIGIDEATDTIYVANTDANTVSVIDGAACNATVHAGCSRRAAVAPVGVSPRRIAVDERTDTIYVTNAMSNTVTMIDGRTCNGRAHSGCGRVPPAGSASTGKTSTTTNPFKAGPRIPASG